MRGAALVVLLACPSWAQVRPVVLNGRASGAAGASILAVAGPTAPAVFAPAPLSVPTGLAPAPAALAPAAATAAPAAASRAASKTPAAALLAGVGTIRAAKTEGEKTAALDALFSGAAASDASDPTTPVVSGAPSRWRALAERHIPGVMKMVDAADHALGVQARLEGLAGAPAAPLTTRLWSGLRAAFYSLPVMMLGVFGGTMISSPWSLVSRGLHIGQTAEGQALLQRAWLPLVAGSVGRGALIQLFLIGGVFAGARGLFLRLGFSSERTTLVVGAAAAAASVPLFMALHFPLMAALPLAGAEAVLVWTYTRSKTLFVPLAANAMLNIVSLYSARMSAWLRAPVSGSLDSLPGIPGFAGVMAVLGVGAALFAASAAFRFGVKKGLGVLKTAVVREWDRLAAFGRWWDRPRADGAAKSLWPVLKIGSLWGIGVYLSTYLAYWGAAAVSPTQEIIPDVLKKSLLMPFDSLVFVFLIGAALEEWMFRRGLFEKMREKLASWKFSARAVVPVAAVASAVVFSLFHYVDWRTILDALRIPLSPETRAMMGVYSFSWAGCLGRVSAGVLLAALYRRSRSMTLSLTAHFTSNLLEAIGLHWGLPWFLTGVTGIFAFQRLQALRRGKRA